MTSQIKCPNCGVFNKNREYCIECNTPLSYKIRRELQFVKEEKERLKQRRLEKKNSPSILDKYSTHRFLIVRILIKVIRSVWFIFMGIGTLIAWLITAIAA